MLTVDTIVTYQPSFNKAIAYTRLRVFEQGGKRIGIVTELNRNPGASVTNAAEDVYRRVQDLYGPLATVIEHYPGKNAEFSIIRTGDGCITWKHVEEADVVAMIGEALAPHTPTDEPAYLQLANESAPPTQEERAARTLAEASAIATENGWLASFLPSRVKVYNGVFDRTGHPAIIVRDERGARRLTHYKRHSPDGFSWGYAGSGCSEAARCILADAMGVAPVEDRDEIPEIDSLYQKYKFKVIAALDKDAPFAILASDVIAWVEARPDRPRVCPTHREIVDDEFPCVFCKFPNSVADE